MAGPVSITCPVCREAFTVPTEVVHVDEQQHVVVVKLDRSGLYGHLTACAAREAAKHAEQPAEQQAGPGKALEREHSPHPVYLPPFIRRGARTCTMCGTTNGACMESLRNSVPCCGACGEGDTHPVPDERA